MTAINALPQPGLTNENPALRQVDLELIVKSGINRTEALMSLYWSSWRLPLKQSTKSQQNLIQNNVARPYEIITNLKGDQPNSQTSCSSAYQNHLPKNHQFIQCLWLWLKVDLSHTKKRQSQNSLLIKRLGPWQNQWFLVFPRVIKMSFWFKRVTSIKTWNQKKLGQQINKLKWQTWPRSLILMYNKHG